MWFLTCLAFFVLIMGFFRCIFITFHMLLWPKLLFRVLPFDFCDLFYCVEYFCHLHAFNIGVCVTGDPFLGEKCCFSTWPHWGAATTCQVISNSITIRCVCINGTCSSCLWSTNISQIHHSRVSISFVKFRDSLRNFAFSLEISPNKELEKFSWSPSKKGHPNA